MPSKTKHLLIIWHSRTNTAQQAAIAAYEAAHQVIDELTALQAESGGNSTSSYEVLLRSALDVSLEELLNADSYLFCAPENLGSLSGIMKEFFDRHYYDLLGQIEGRHYSAIISAGSDGHGALRQLERICTGWRLQQVVPAIILNTQSSSEEAIRAPKQLSDSQREQAGEIGATLLAHMAI